MTQSPPAPGENIRRHRSVTIVLLTLMAMMIMAQRIHLAEAPLHGDICAYAVIGHEMLQGRRLYSDLWERKPPLLYATNAAAELVVGYGRQEIFFLGVTTAILTLLGLYAAGRTGGFGAIGGLLAAGLWTILSSDRELAADQPHPEVFINLCLVIAFSLIISRARQRFIVRGMLIGAFMAAATLYKHNTVLACIALLVGSVVLARSRTESGWLDPRRLFESFTAVLVIAMAWAGTFAYFAAVGRLHDFVEVVFNQNFAYSGNIAGNFASSLQPTRFFPIFMIWAAGPAVLVAASAIFSLARHKNILFRQEWFVWLAWAVGTWATVALTGYIYPHYFQLWLPVWCVAGGWAGANLLRRDFPRLRGLRVAVVVVVAITLIWRQMMQFTLTPEQWVQHQYPYVNFEELDQVTTELNRVLKPGEIFWELGEDNALYFNTHHSPPIGLLYIDPLIYGKQRPAYWQRLMGDLHRTQPGLVLLSAGWNKFFRPDDPVFLWIRQNYVLFAAANVPRGYQFWLRRGSDLQRRLITPQATNGL